MGSGYVLGGGPKCPKCGEHKFSWPGELNPDSSITCNKCGYITTIEEAGKAGSTPPQAGGK